MAESGGGEDAYNPTISGRSSSVTRVLRKKPRRVAVRIPTDRITRSKFTERLEQVEIDDLMKNVRRSLYFGEKDKRVGMSLVDPFADQIMSDEEIHRNLVEGGNDEGDNIKVRYKDKLNELRHELHSNTPKLDFHEKRIDTLDTLCTRFSALNPVISKQSEDIRENKTAMITIMDDMVEMSRQFNVNKGAVSHIAD